MIQVNLDCYLISFFCVVFLLLIMTPQQHHHHPPQCSSLTPHHHLSLDHVGNVCVCVCVSNGMQALQPCTLVKVDRAQSVWDFSGFYFIIRHMGKRTPDKPSEIFSEAFSFEAPG